MISHFARLDFAHIDCNASILVKGYPNDKSITIGCFGYYLEKDGEKIIIDTGIDDIDTVNLTKSSADDWKRSQGELPMAEHLKRLGICANEIDRVYVTHSHYDHISSLYLFENAKIYISDAEYRFLVSGNNPHAGYLKRVIDFLDAKMQSGGLVLTGDEVTDGDIRLKTVGGHTPGSMFVYVEDLLFTGDGIFLLDSIKENQPIGFCTEPEKAIYALGLCSEHKGKVFTGHDLNCKADTEVKNV